MTDPAVTKKRRWWFYVLLAGAILLVTALTLVLAGTLYWNHLLRTYTDTQPKPLPNVEASPTAQEQLEARWVEFKEAVAGRKAPPPLQLTADDLNVFLTGMAKSTEKIFLRLAGDRLQGQFSLPLNKSGQGKLKGRYLNGVATFAFTFEDGWLTLTVAQVEANGKPIPKWILRQLQKKNFLQDFDHDWETIEFLQKLESIEVKGGAIIFKPAQRK